MKKNLYFLFIIPNLFFSQELDMGIQGLTISPLPNNEINVNLQSICGTLFSYNTHIINTLNNEIEIKVCYFVSGATAIDEDIQNFTIQIPNNGSYILNIKLFGPSISLICNYFTIQDSATLNFDFPLIEPVSLANYNFDKSIIGSVVFPNPFQESFCISNTVGKNEDFEFKIIDISGRVVKFGKVINDEKINAETLQTGTYILEIRDKKGISSLKKVIKN
jgi:Secretion system C-terminal sorting domain